MDASRINMVTRENLCDTNRESVLLRDGIHRSLLGTCTYGVCLITATHQDVCDRVDPLIHVPAHERKSLASVEVAGTRRRDHSERRDTHRIGNCKSCSEHLDDADCGSCELKMLIHAKRMERILPCALSRANAIDWEAV